MVILLIIAGIFFELIVLIGVVYFCLKYFRKSNITSDKIEVKINSKNITSDVIRDGVKEAIREISFEDEQQRLIDKKNKITDGVYSSIEQDTPVKKSGGNLIPYGLSESEREILEMFYGNND